MGILSKIFNRFTPLPKPPEVTDSIKRIYIEEDDLEWDSLKAVQKVLRGYATILGHTVDLRGMCISGANILRSRHRDDEKAPGIKIKNIPLHLTNGWITDIPGGLMVYSPHCRFSELKFLNSGEDFLSTVGENAIGIRISRCDFWNDKDGDKSIQLNQAKEAVLNDVKIVGGITGIRVQKDSYKTSDVMPYMKRMKFIGCQTGLNVAGGATVRMSESSFQNVGEKWVTGKGARVISV